MYLDLIEVHKKCIEEIFSYNYFVEIFITALSISGFLSKSQLISLEDPKDILLFWNLFWSKLPEDESIDRPPFDLISDLISYKISEDFNLLD